MNRKPPSTFGLAGAFARLAVKSSVPGTAQTVPALVHPVERMNMKNANPIPTNVNPDDFWKLVDSSESGGCWPWTGRVDRHGYGQVSHREDGMRRQVAAHRVAYSLAVAPFDRELVVDHLCRNRCCCNPAHLEPVTDGENTRRGVVAFVNSRPVVDGAPVCANGHLVIGSNARRHSKYPHLRVCVQCSIDRRARFNRRRAA
jgi:hypothetical protein